MAGFSVELDFEWDDDKARSNLRKHGIPFALARRVFFDPHRIERLDRRTEYGEDRFLSVGLADLFLLAVVHTQRSDAIRLISARKAKRHEQDDYWKNRQDDPFHRCPSFE